MRQAITRYLQLLKLPKYEPPIRHRKAGPDRAVYWREKELHSEYRKEDPDKDKVEEEYLRYYEELNGHWWGMEARVEILAAVPAFLVPLLLQLSLADLIAQYRDEGGIALLFTIILGLASSALLLRGLLGAFELLDSANKRKFADEIHVARLVGEIPDLESDPRKSENLPNPERTVVELVQAFEHEPYDRLYKVGVAYRYVLLGIVVFLLYWMVSLLVIQPKG